MMLLYSFGDVSLMFLMGTMFVLSIVAMLLALRLRKYLQRPELYVPVDQADA